MYKLLANIKSSSQTETDIVIRKFACIVLMISFKFIALMSSVLKKLIGLIK